MSRPGAARWLAAAALILGVLAVGLDVTVLSVALPTLSTSLHASESDLQWFVSAYALALAASMLPAGLMGDRFGRKRVMVVALVLFGAGSAACAFATAPASFIAARVVLGVAGAVLIVTVLSNFAVLFTEDERPRAVGVWAAANFLALPVGPIFGGWLLTHLWWGWIFLMNVPVAGVGLVAVLLLVPESRSSNPPDLDPVGMVTASAGLAAITYGIIDLGRYGGGNLPSWLVAMAGVLVLAGFFFWERRLGALPGGRPIVDLNLFRSPSFTWGVVVCALGGLSLMGILFTLPQYSQGVLGLDPEASGVRLLPTIAGLILGALPADRVSLRAGARVTVAAGFAACAAALLVGSTTSATSGVWFQAGWSAAVGWGMGLGFATAASAALQRVPSDASGVASAVIQAMQKVGMPLGSAILGSVIATGYQGHLHLAGLPAALAQAARTSLFAGVAVAHGLHSEALLATVRMAFVHGMDSSLEVAAAISGLAALLALVFLPGPRSVVDAQATAAAGVPNLG